MGSLRGADATVASGGTTPASGGTGTVTCHDLRGTAAARTLRYPEGDVLVVSGLPGGGKSTLIRSALARPAPVPCDVARSDVVDSQDTRERWERRLPVWLPYGVYRPLVRLAHYAALRRALASGASVVVHDCGTQSWVRRWLARDAVRRGRALHLLLLDVTPEEALAGQAARGRGVSGYAFRRHVRAVRKLTAAAESGTLPVGCVSSALLDRAAAQALRGIAFTAPRTGQHVGPNGGLDGGRDGGPDGSLDGAPTSPGVPTSPGAPTSPGVPTATVPSPARGDGTVAVDARGTGSTGSTGGSGVTGVTGDTGDTSGRAPDATGVSGPAQA